MVTFKSIPDMFEKEKNGDKPNTVREIDVEDERFERLYSRKQRVITIENTITGETFCRAITDVSILDNLMIISWKHKESVK